MLLRTQGPSALFAENKLVLQVPASEADKVRVFHAAGECFVPSADCTISKVLNSIHKCRWGSM